MNLNDDHQKLGVVYRYGFSILLFAFALAVRLLILPVESGFAFITFYPLIVIVFYLCNIGPGIWVVILSSFFSYYILTPPFWVLSLKPVGFISILIFVFSAALIAFIVKRMQYYQQALSISEQSHIAILNDQTETICRFKVDGEILYVNDAFCRFFSKTAESVIGTSWQPIVIEEDLEQVHAKLNTLSPLNPVVTIENRVVTANRGVRWGQFINRAFYDDHGNLLQIQSVGRDITKQKQTELANRELYNRLTLIASRIPGVIYQYKLYPDGTSCFPYASEGIRDIYRITPEQVMSDASVVFKVIHPDDYEGVISSIQQSVSSLEPWQYEYRVKFADETVRWLSGNAIPTLEPDGSVLWHGCIIDITERKLIESKLFASSNEIQDLYNHAPCGYHSLDSEGIIIRINNTELQWLGYERDEVIGKMKITDFLTDTYKEHFREFYPCFLNVGHVENLEFDLVSKSGDIRSIIANASAIRDDENQFIMSRTILYDITELKETQVHLKQLTDGQQAMLDNELVGIIKLRDRRIVWINSAATHVFCYEREELLGQLTKILYPDDAAFEAFGIVSYPILNSGIPYRAQIELVRKDNEKIWMDISGSKLPGSYNESLWMMLDITPHKKHQLEVEEMAYHDILTGLPNRLLVADRIKQALAQAERANQILAVCYLDLDGFKPVNDQYGHAAGDKLLIELARRMEKLVRGNDTVGRIGGDEFVLLLTNLDTADDYRSVLNRVIEEINTPFLIDSSTEVSVGASIGVTLFPNDGDDADILLRHSDQAMYQAKRLGRNRVYEYADNC